MAASFASAELPAWNKFRGQKSVGVKIRPAVASDGSETAFVFIYDCVKVNTQASLKMREDHVLPSNNESFLKGRVFTQDGTPSHKSHETQHLCKKHQKRLWIRTSPHRLVKTSIPLILPYSPP